MRSARVTVTGALVALLGCSPYAWQLPEGFPEPLVPADNPMSEEKVELGRFLFYDERLSANGTQACASCHEQARAFSDGRVTPVGSTGHAVPRNSPGLANVAYLSTYTWANPLLDTLEAQALVPLTGEAPVELGTGAHVEEVMQRFREDGRYAELFRAAFPGEEDPFKLPNVARALASFQRTLLSGNAPFDRFQRGDPEALSPAARRGMELFFGERAECYHCHGGPHLTNSFRTTDVSPSEEDFQNNGLYNVDGAGAYPEPNTGLFEFTRDAADMGRFRVPSLRNVALTAPYMHDGSIATLAEVVEHYAQGGRNIPTGPYAGDGRENPHKSSLVRPFPLSEEERADLLAFLESLTDTDFVNEPRFSNPFK